jgi:small ligand-binding sensory domain FIST
MTDRSTQLRFACGISDEPQTDMALQQVAQQIESRLTDQVDLLVVFASSHHAHAFGQIDEYLTRAFTPRVRIGATVESALGGHRELQFGPGLSVLAATMPDATLTPVRFDHVDWSTLAKTPEELRRVMLKDQDSVEAVLLLADPFSTPINALLPAFHAALPGVPIVGGMASGARAPGDNRLLFNGQLLNQGALALAIGGQVNVACTVSQGCRPIGESYVITRSKRHIVFELGGHKATKVINNTIAQLSADDRELVSTHGLLVGRVIDEYKSRFGRGDFLIRNLAGFDEEKGYIAVHDPHVRTGQTIQFHLRDQATAAEDFSLLLEAQKLYGSGAGALLFTCTGRGLNLFDEPDTDVKMVRDALGDLPLAGFFAAGEIGPVGGQSFLHGHCASLIVFRPA